MKSLYVGLFATLFGLLVQTWPQTAQAQPACIVSQITHTPAGVSNDGASITADGTRIAFASDRDGNYEIFLVEAKTGASRQITHNPGQPESKTID